MPPNPLKIAEATGRFSRQLTSYQRPAVLVVDNVGYLPLDRAEANMVSSLVSSRYDRGNMIVTSNKSFAKARRTGWATGSGKRAGDHRPHVTLP